jgi:Protein of unknown function (DUF3460)
MFAFCLTKRFLHELWAKIHRMYESEFTKFLKELKQERPQLESRQREGRARLWDKTPVNLDEQRRALDSKVPQAPYVYQTK